MKRALLFAALGALILAAGLSAAHTIVVEEHVVTYTIGNESGAITITDTDQLPHETVTVTVTEGEEPPGPTECAAGQYEADYYSGTALAGAPLLSRCEGALDYDWGSSGPGSGVPSNNFSARWVGTFNFAAGAFTFTVRADDGVRLYVDGALVIDEWVDQSATTYTATRTLIAGAHEVKVEFYENGGDAVIQASWVSGTPPPPPPPQTGFPNASNTGPTGTLTNVSGNLTISTAGAVIQNQNRTGCIDVRANNVTIRNSEIHCLTSDYGIDHLNGNTGLVMEDLLVECGPTNGTCISTTSNMTLRRTEVFGSENLIWVEENSLIEDNYLHDTVPYNPITDPHTDGLQMPTPTRNVTIRHNTIYGGYVNQQNFGNSAITSGQSTNVQVLDNLLAGGGHTLRCPREPGGYTWANNRFSRIFVFTVGGFGPLEPSCFQHTHFGNVIHETGELVG